MTSAESYQTHASGLKYMDTLNAPLQAGTRTGVESVTG